jgi:antitoxin ParD1/3/4
MIDPKIRKDQERRAKIAALQKAVTEGLESGLSGKNFEDIIAAARQSLEENT